MVKHRGAMRSEYGGKLANEDNCKTSQKGLLYFILTDGVGASESSRFAAKMAANFASEKLDAEVINVKSETELIQLLDNSAQYANKEIIKHNYKEKENGEVPGYTTIDIWALYKKTFHGLHVGDARLYVLDKQKHMKLITQDENASWLPIKKDKHTPPEITKAHPLSKNLINMLGKETPLKIKKYAIPLEQLSKVLAATDGLYRCLTDDEIRDILVKDLAPADTLKELFDKARNPDKIIPIFLEQNDITDKEVAKAMLRHDNRTAVLFNIGGE